MWSKRMSRYHITIDGHVSKSISTSLVQVKRFSISLSKFCNKTNVCSLVLHSLNVTRVKVITSLGYYDNHVLF